MINKKNSLKKTILIFFIISIFSTSVFAVKDLFSLQGKVELNGALVDDGNVTVLIYEAPTGGNPIYNSSTDFNNSVQDGFFDIMVGSTTTELDLIMNGIYYLDLEINQNDLDWGSNERRQFQSPVGNITNLSNVVYLSGGNVGVGTASPDGTLHAHTATAGSVTAHASGDNFIVENSAASGMSILYPDANAGRIYFGSPSNNENAVIYSDYNAGNPLFDIYNNGSIRLRIDGSGNVGIGTTSPTELLDIDGNLRLRATEPIINGSLGNMNILAEDSLTITMDSNSQDAGGETISFKSDPSNTVMTITEGNRVGINITNPKAALHVKSVIRIGVEAGFFETVAASGEACDTACEADDASVGGFHASSGSCLKAWNDGGAETRDCSSTAAGTKHCLCTGAY